MQIDPISKFSCATCKTLIRAFFPTGEQREIHERFSCNLLPFPRKERLISLSTKRNPRNRAEPRKDGQSDVCNLPHSQSYPQSLHWLFFLGYIYIYVPYLELRLVLILSNVSRLSVGLCGSPTEPNPTPPHPSPPLDGHHQLVELSTAVWCSGS